jgi:3-hydroxybutyryl-CoA dehydrogenase
MEKIFVLGSGVMGTGIAQTFAQSGFQVVVADLQESIVSKAIAGVDSRLASQVKKEKITAAAKAEIMAKLSGTTDFALAADCAMVVEATIESMDLKKKVFSQLDAICKVGTILASNTSSLSITEIASATSRPENVIGMHFFNPAPVMKLVEIIRGMKTSQAAFDKTREITVAIGKEPVEVAEAPGFIVNRMLVPLVNEAVFILQEGIASAEDIDTAMKCGANHPMGPLALGDLMGLDVALAVLDILYKETGDPKYRACSLLRKYVRAGLLGRKTGQGFYKY